jgi:hypothetical protein
MRAHAHVRLEEDGVVAVADGPILASAADAHVLDLGVARRHTAARPRRHRIVAAVDRAGTVPRGGHQDGSNRVAQQGARLEVLLDKVVVGVIIIIIRCRPTIVRLIGLKRAAEGPDSASEALRHTRFLASCASVLLVVTATPECASRGNADTCAWVRNADTWRGSATITQVPDKPHYNRANGY